LNKKREEEILTETMVDVVTVQCQALQERGKTLLENLNKFQEKTSQQIESVKLQVQNNNNNSNRELRMIVHAQEPQASQNGTTKIDLKTLMTLYKFYHQWLTRLIIHRLPELEDRESDFIFALNFVIARYLIAYAYRSRKNVHFNLKDCSAYIDDMHDKLFLEYVWFRLVSSKPNPSQDTWFQELEHLLSRDRMEKLKTKATEFYKNSDVLKNKKHVSLSFADLESIITKVHACMPDLVLNADLDKLGHHLLTKNVKKQELEISDVLMGEMSLPSPTYDMLFRFVTCQHCKDTDFDDDPESITVTL
jgi:hypothetical protein